MKSLVFLTCLTAALPAAGTTFNVNSTLDLPDLTPGDGVCRASNNTCTLRAAVQEANQSAAADTIVLPAKTHILTRGQINVTSNMTIRGANKSTSIIDGGSRSRVFSISAGNVVQLSALTVRKGHVLDADGGCVTNEGKLTLSNVIVTVCVVDGYDDFGHNGGGIANFGELTLRESQVTHNSLDNPTTRERAAGGGIYSVGRLVISRSLIDGNSACCDGLGGGLFSAGDLDITESNITYNDASASEWFCVGGLFISGTARIAKSTVAYNSGDIGGISAHGTITITNTTISGNRGSGWASFFRGAGGIAHWRGDLLIKNSTIAANRGVDYSAGGIGVPSPIDHRGTVTLRNTIISGNTSNSAPDCDLVSALTYSLIGNTRGCKVPAGPGTGNLKNVDAMLGPLDNNGGKTQTHALLTGSIATDAASPAPVGSGGDSCEKTDQRGITRPQNGRCDMGAFEFRPGIPHLADAGEDAEPNTLEQTP